MNRIEYIRYSHRRANSRVRAWIGSVRMRLVRRSRLLGWIWMVPASIFYALVVLFSWLTFCVVLFRDPRFTLHYLESEIECRGLSGAEARRYLDEQHRDYERRLAYGNFTRDEQRRIDQTFAYLYNRYPAPVRDDLNARLDEVQSAVAEIAGFTRQRQEELEQARERETALQAQAEKRRAINRSRTGFDPTPEDFSPRLTDRQLDLLTEHINRIGLFRRDVTRPEVAAARLPASGTVANDPQQAAGAAARIAERRAVHHPEVAARGGSQGVLPLEAGQAAYSQGSLSGQADGRHHRRETRAADSRLHPGPGGRAIIACP